MGWNFISVNSAYQDCTIEYIHMDVSRLKMFVYMYIKLVAKFQISKVACTVLHEIPRIF